MSRWEATDNSPAMTEHGATASLNAAQSVRGSPPRGDIRPNLAGSRRVLDNVCVGDYKRGNALAGVHSASV
jgi:hypothetical protein